MGAEVATAAAVVGTTATVGVVVVEATGTAPATSAASPGTSPATAPTAATTRVTLDRTDRISGRRAESEVSFDRREFSHIETIGEALSTVSLWNCGNSCRVVTIN